MSKPGGYPQGGQEPYYGERRAPLPANQRFSDRSYEDYGQPQQARSSVTSEASVDATISRMASMKIGDDRSAPVTSQGLYTPQRVNSPRPRPNQQMQGPPPPNQQMQGPPPPIQQMQRSPPPIQQMQGPPPPPNQQIQGPPLPNQQMQGPPPFSQREYLNYGPEEQYYGHYPQNSDPSIKTHSQNSQNYYNNQYPPQDYPPQDYPPQDYPPQDYPPKDGQEYYPRGQNYDTASIYTEDSYNYYPTQPYDYDNVSQGTNGYDYYHRGYPPSEVYPPSERYPPSEGYPPGEGYPPSEGYPPGEDYYNGGMNPHQYYQDPYYQDQYYGPPDEYGSRPYGQPPRPYAENTNRYSGQRNSGPSNNVEDKTLYTPEAIEQYRQKIKSTTDLDALFAYARYIISASVHISRDEPDPKNAKKKKDALLQEAIKILKRLATQSMGRPSHPDAQFYLADCYGSGSLGLPQDLEKAFNLYEQASKSRHPAATYRTAVCYEVGGGTKRDPHRAVQFYRKAAALGDTAAMYKLGMIMLKGQLGQHENPREAINWLKRAAAQADESNPHALHQLGLLHAKPENEPPIIPSLIRNEGHAFEEFKRAADLGYAPSCFKLGCCFEYGQLGCPVDPRESIRYYSRAAEKSDANAELALSGWYLTGSETVLKQSDTEAYLWARKAADKGLAKAEYAIGYYTEQGIGVKQNLEEAKRWYMRAAAQGNKRAMQRLTELKHMGSKSHLNRSKHTRAQANKEDCTIC